MGAMRILSFKNWQNTQAEIKKMGFNIPTVTFAELRPDRDLEKDSSDKPTSAMLKWRESTGEFNKRNISLPDERARKQYEVWIKNGSLKASPVGYSVRLEPSRDG